MFRSNRKAMLLAAVSGIGFVAATQAQTWVNPNVGNWSVPGNWIPVGVPASANTTTLKFNGNGVQTYTASNNLGTFTLNALDFENLGLGTVNVAGDTLSFAGTNPAISQNGSGAVVVANNIELTADTYLNGIGSGTLTLSGILSTNPGADLTNGWFLNKSSSGVTNLTGSGTIRGYLANAGITNFNGAGGYNLTTDGFDATDTALVVGGTTDPTTVSFLNGNNLATNVAIGFDPASVATLNVSGSSARLNLPLTTPATQGDLATLFGNTTININSGGQVRTLFVDMGAGEGTTSLNITGTDSLLRTAQGIFGYGVATASSNSITVSNNGRLESFAEIDAGVDGSLYFGYGDRVSSTVTVNTGGTVRTNGDIILSWPDTNAGGALATTTLTINGAGSSVSAESGGQFATSIANFGSFGGNTVVSVSNGGALSASAYFGTYRQGLGSLTVSDAGSTFGVSQIMIIGYSLGAQQHVNIQNDADATCNGEIDIAYLGGASGTLTVSGAGSTFTQTVTGDLDFPNYFDVAGGASANAGTEVFGTVRVLNGGSLTADWFEIASFGQTNATGTLTVDGTGSEFVSSIAFSSVAGANTRSTVTVSNGGFADFGLQLSASSDAGAAGTLVGTSTINIQSGGFAIAQFVNLSTNVGTTTVNVDGTDSALFAPYGNFSSVAVADDNGAQATVNITNGGAFGVLDLTTATPEFGGTLTVAGSAGALGTINMSGTNSFLTAGTLELGGTGVTAGGTGTINQNGGDTEAPNTRVFVNGRYNYNGGTAYLGNLIVDGRVTLSAGNNKTLETDSVVINASGQIDLNNNGMIVDYTGGSPAGTIRSYIKAGRNTGAWNGTTGITSTAAAGNPSRLGVGYSEVGTGSTALNITSFRGIDVDTDTVVARETYLGDADLDGDVDSIDFGRLAAGYGLTADGVWSNGDFNYDDKVNTLDFNHLAGNFGAAPLGGPTAGPLLDDGGSTLADRHFRKGQFDLSQVEAEARMMMAREGGAYELDNLTKDPSRLSQLGLGDAGGGVGSVVPEPASLSVVGLASLALAARRRRV